ncbi:interleukin-20 isoform X2 [Oryctolagus cuniculus]|uniref:interleukin-20 isoform X2 n=1 Tax=Oryctolagus cuniculus TaxID=9986 RepID=UPI0007EE4DAC|nr:interleukin-20 isoform X2 [Oryctolagus cuniculus]
MRAAGLALGFLCAVFHLLWAPSTGLRTLQLGSCVVTTDLQEIQSVFSELRHSVAKDDITDIRILRRTESLQDTKPKGRCCLLRRLLRLYMERVFNNYPAPDHQTLRKISRLANSLLTIKKDLRLCHANKKCHCGKEAMEKYNQILRQFEQLEPQAAVVKALGELDILLQWMEETVMDGGDSEAERH